MRSALAVAMVAAGSLVLRRVDRRGSAPLQWWGFSFASSGALIEAWAAALRTSSASAVRQKTYAGKAMNNNDVLDALVRINDVLDTISEQLAKLDNRITRMADGGTVAHTETINAISDLARAVDTLDLA
jgi:hypothetical protein